VSKRRTADVLSFADPAHPEHRRPSWDVGDLQRCVFPDVPRQTVNRWVREGLLTPDDWSGRLPKFTPANVLAATVPTRRPMRRTSRTR
jgi:hypothetical protein